MWFLIGTTYRNRYHIKQSSSNLEQNLKLKKNDKSSKERATIVQHCITKCTVFEGKNSFLRLTHDLYLDAFQQIKMYFSIQQGILTKANILEKKKYMKYFHQTKLHLDFVKLCIIEKTLHPFCKTIFNQRHQISPL